MRTLKKLITCIVPEANASHGAAALRESYQLQTINHHFARGIGKSSPLIRRGIGEKTEKVVLSVVVDAKMADEIFEFLYHEAEINRPRGGMIYMNAIASAALQKPPQLQETDKTEEAAKA